MLAQFRLDCIQSNLTQPQFNHHKSGPCEKGTCAPTLPCTVHSARATQAGARRLSWVLGFCIGWKVSRASGCERHFRRGWYSPQPANVCWPRWIAGFVNNDRRVCPHLLPNPPPTSLAGSRAVWGNPTGTDARYTQREREIERADATAPGGSEEHSRVNSGECCARGTHKEIEANVPHITCFR